MIYDVVLAGHTGTVGKELRKALEKSELSFTTFDNFSVDDYCVVFINCSNISTRPIKSAALLRNTYEKSSNRCDIFLQIQSIGTLLEFSKLDVDRFNMGAGYRLLDKYLFGKIVQEKLLLSAASEDGCKIAFAYLGNFDGPSAAWRDLKLRALAQGWVSPILSEKSRNAGADGDRLAKFVHWCYTSHRTFKLISRHLIVNQGEAWQETLGHNVAYRPTNYKELFRARSVARLLVYISLAMISKIVPYWAWWRLVSHVNTQRTSRGNIRTSQGPVDFSGFPERYFFSRLRDFDTKRFRPKD
jgi:hypothetical protein